MKKLRSHSKPPAQMRKTHRNLAAGLRRDGIDHAGPLATLLLDTFLDKGQPTIHPPRYFQRFFPFGNDVESCYSVARASVISS